MPTDLELIRFIFHSDSIGYPIAISRQKSPKDKELLLFRQST